MQPTPTQAQAMDRHRAFHQKIAERAAAIGLPVQECEVAPSIVPKRVEIVEHKEPETYVPIISCDGQVVYVTFDSVVEALRGGGVDESVGKRIRTENIQRVVGEHYGVSRIDLLSARRTANVVRPRQVAMYLAKTLTIRSLPEIGRRFGGRDHTTVLHAVRKIARLIETDAALKDTIQAIKSELGAA